MNIYLALTAPVAHWRERTIDVGDAVGSIPTRGRRQQIGLTNKAWGQFLLGSALIEKFYRDLKKDQR